MAVDSAGDVLVAGAKEGATPFETTGFVSTLTPDGKTLVASKQFEEGVSGPNRVTGLAVGPDGLIHVIGVSAENETPHSYYRQLDGSGNVLYSTTVFDYGEVSLLRVDKSGNVYIGGSISDFDVVKIDASHRIHYRRTLGGTDTDLLRSIAPNSDGTVWLGGWTSSPDFPTKDTLAGCNSGGSGVIVKLGSTGKVLRSSFLPGYNAAAIAASHLAGTFGQSAFTFLLDEGRWPQGGPGPACLVGGATFQPVGAVPNLVATLFGSNMSGAQVTAAGTSANFLYAGDGQVNFVFPAVLPDGPLDVCVKTASGEGCIDAYREASHPQCSKCLPAILPYSTLTGH